MRLRRFATSVGAAAACGAALAACGSSAPQAVHPHQKVTYHTGAVSATTTPSTALGRTAPTKPATTSPSSAVTSQVLSVLVRYVQAREDRDGANQATPSSWADSVSSIITPPWLSHLQATTNTAYGPWQLGHQDHLVVTASVSNCAWDTGIEPHTASAGAVTCALQDTTKSSATHQDVPASQVPFGWPFNGPQSLGVSLKFVQQGGHWLVTQDVTGTGD